MRNCKLFQTVYSLNVRLLLCMAALMALFQVARSSSVLCLACSYTYAGDGTVDYECVSEPRNFTQITTANCTTGLCTIRTVYTTGYERINSLYRGCGTVDLNDCDAPEGVYPTCTFTCSSSECNDQDGALWTGSGVGDGSDDNGDGDGASQKTVPVILIGLLFILVKMTD